MHCARPAHTAPCTLHTPAHCARRALASLCSFGAGAFGGFGGNSFNPGSTSSFSGGAGGGGRLGSGPGGGGLGGGGGGYGYGGLQAQLGEVRLGDWTCPGCSRHGNGAEEGGQGWPEMARDGQRWPGMARDCEMALDDLIIPENSQRLRDDMARALSPSAAPSGMFTPPAPRVSAANLSHDDGAERAAPRTGLPLGAPSKRRA